MIEFPSKVVPNSFIQEGKLIEDFESSKGESLRPVENTVEAMVKRKNMKGFLLGKGARHEDYI